MAQIPVGNFGYATPEVRQSNPVSTRVQDDSAGMVARTLGQAANKFTADITAGMAEQADIEARKKKAIAATKVMEYETKLQEGELALQKEHAEGRLGSDALLGSWENLEKKLREDVDKYANELDPDSASAMMAEVNARKVNRLQGFQGHAINAAKGDLQASLVESGEAFRKANLGNAVATEAYVNGEFGAELDRAFGPEAAKIKRQMIEQANLDAVNQAITKAGDDVGSLEAVRNQLGSKEAQARMDPDRLMSLQASISGRIDSLREREAAKAERESLKREMQATNSVESTMEFITQGNILSPEAIVQVEEKTRGTSKEGVAANILKYQDGIKKILDAPAEQRKAYIEDQRRRVAQEGTTPEKLAEFKMLENAVKQRDEMEKSDPHLAYEVKTGSGRITVDPDSDAMNIAIAEREARAKQANTPDLLRPDERKKIADKLTNGSPDQKLQEITKITGKLSPQQSMKVMAEAGMEKDAGYSAYAGMMVAKGKKTEALAILKGDEIIKNGAEGYVRKSKFTDSLPAEFNEAFKHDEQARKNAIDVAYRYYLSSVVPGKEAENMISDDASVAIEKTIGKTATVGRSAILMPDGYDEDQFSETLQSSFAKAKARSTCKAMLMTINIGRL